MLKKFVSSMLAVILLAGCSASSSASASNVAAEVSSSDQSAQIVDDLGLKDSMTKVKDRVVLGMIFSGDKDAFTEGTLYLSSTTGNSDTVGVFHTKDIDSCKKYINSYLDTQKQQTQTYYPEEVFKISNAIVEENDNTVVLIVCQDIEKAKKSAKEILNA